MPLELGDNRSLTAVKPKTKWSHSFSKPRGFISDNMLEGQLYFLLYLLLNDRDAPFLVDSQEDPER